MHTLGLAFALVGLNISWIPGFGWVGVVLCLAGCLLGLRSVSDRESRTLATILGTCALSFGTVGLVFGLGVQIKHGPPALDGLLLPLPWGHAALGAAGAALALLLAVLLARFRNRTGGVAVALILFVALVTAGSSALVGADRELAGAAEGAAGDRVDPVDRVDLSGPHRDPDPSPDRSVPSVPSVLSVP
jgi:hypothetical protein